MPQKIISIILLTIFTLFIVAPAVVSIADKSFDTSVYFNTNAAEEENSSHGKLKIFEVKFLENGYYDLSLVELEKEKSYTSYLKNYTQFVAECVSPPPESV